MGTTTITFDDLPESLKKMARSMANPEELHPELKAHVETRGSIRWLHHPLMVIPMFGEHLHAIANESFVAKRDAVKQFTDEGDWMKVLLLYERPYRLQAFLALEAMMGDVDYWKCLGWIWTDCEHPHVNYAFWVTLFDSMRKGRGWMMESFERRALRALPDDIIVFRGSNHRRGLAWTIDEKKAIWFARREGDGHGKPGRVFKGVVKKQDVIAHFLTRGESEIVVDPKKVKRLPYEPTLKPVANE